MVHVTLADLFAKADPLRPAVVVPDQNAATTFNVYFSGTMNQTTYK